MRTFQSYYMDLTKKEIQNFIFKIIIVLLLLYFFLIGVKTLSTSLQLIGGNFAQTLLNISKQPLIALMGGMLSTILFQSSSVTTVIIVGLVSAGEGLSITGAVPMIMGANLGTSVTNTLVSLGYLKNMKSFQKAFAAATVHDFFNILTVFILLPLEILTGFLEKTALFISSLIYGSFSGFHYRSPIKAMIKMPVTMITNTIHDFADHRIVGIILLIVSILMIVLSLALIVKTMKRLLESYRMEIIDKIFSQNIYRSILFGIILTMAVQSSSITTSLLIPMAGTGLISLHTIFPITIGANIGTTVTGLLAALTGNVAGLSIALVHFLFNLLGALIFFPLPRLRAVPIQLAELLASSLSKSKFIGLGYVGIVFFILPLTCIFFSSSFS